MRYIDFHTHLDMDSFAGKRQDILDQCFGDENFYVIVVVADPFDDRSPGIARQLSENNPRLYTMIGAHPHESRKYEPKVEKIIRNFLMHPKTIAVGEAGMDFHYHHSPVSDQTRVFKEQIELAREFQKPLVVHCREAEADVLKILDQSGFKQPVVFHSFTGDRSHAREIVERGYAISFSGIITFKKAQYLREIVKICPLSQLFTETDAPYLTPVPHRGKPNTPLHVKEVARTVADIKGIPLMELNRRIADNFNRIFCNQKEVI